MDCLTDDYFDPAYILLFGRLAGGTPHSDAAAYGLLVVVPEAPDYHWMQAKRILRYRMPVKHRRITYIHLYVMTTGYVESHRAPFLYFAHAEGDLLYCTEHHRFRRPRYPIDFDAAHADDKLHFDTFRMLGNDLLEQAQGAFIEGRNRRLAAIFSPFPCLSAAIRRSGCRHLFFGLRGIVGRGWDCLAPLAFPLPAGGIPARTGKYRTTVFLLCGATSSKLSRPA